MATEFDLIDHFFRQRVSPGKGVNLGIGDDAALLQVPEGYQLVYSTDTFNAGVHFPNATSAEDIGYKSLAVSLSDIAAMGAKPLWVGLALTLPKSDKAWLEKFTHGFFELCTAHNVSLVGGDLTQGPLAINTQVFGLLPVGKALRRDAAKVDDVIVVSGKLGAAGLALRAPDEPNALSALNRPQPQIQLGQQLLDSAHACIDISDGLLADLSHILTASRVGAVVNIDHVPVADVVLKCLSSSEAQQLALTAGDDYELCFTLPESRVGDLPAGCEVVGKIVAKSGLRLVDAHGNSQKFIANGYEHFS